MKRRAIAIAIRRSQHPLASLIDFMYGTPERTRITLVFVYALLALGFVLAATDAYSATAVCYN